MNFSKVKEGLKKHPKEETQIYIDYLREMKSAKDKQGQLRNKWFYYFKESLAISLFEKVAKDGLYIDGDTITLEYRGKVLVSYNYQAYKNKLLMIYPDSKFDQQLVNEGDEFSFKKESGKVFYTHKINNPFHTNKNIIGAYCIIKNERGEFIETLNMDDINKMRSVARTQKIWKTWFGEMVMKSVIKRACKRHFKDVIRNMEEVDNENYDLSKVDVDPDVQQEIEECDDLDDLQAIYSNNINAIKDEKEFLAMLTKRKKEINENS